MPPDNGRSLSTVEVAGLLGGEAPLRERTLWTMPYETVARAEEIPGLDISDLDTTNRCAVVPRKGSTRNVVYRQTDPAARRRDR
ncbi:site-specific integrase [Nocardia paucivorans]|uniref:site-specific integrase n=1 Tax=Nocardia paucivorans TaxID=114259 RepID=UPI0006849524|nr:site-specific integrase [Nocardia paucivorans]